MNNPTIAVIRGDGIGPEIMDATLHVLDACNAGLDYDFVEAGVAAYEKLGELLPQPTLNAIAKHKVALKSPLSTPIGGGFSSINVALRRHFDLYANVRPAITFPGTKSRYDNIDLITVRENTEGAYRSEVHKANIMKTTSGLFLNVGREVAKEYRDIACNDMIVDNTCMQLVMNPQQFDMIVTTNLFGDIISDLCAGLVGGLGLAPGANIGSNVAIFEAVHGSAPDIAGKGIANPCALLLGAAQMLAHMDKVDLADRLRLAIRETIQARDRITPDLGGTGKTHEFAEAIAERMQG